MTYYDKFFKNKYGKSYETVVLKIDGDMIYVPFREMKILLGMIREYYISFQHITGHLVVEYKFDDIQGRARFNISQGMPPFYHISELPQEFF